jgi:hypothetical protein
VLSGLFLETIDLSIILTKRQKNRSFTISKIYFRRQHNT